MRIGLALGGGAARGIAHVGALSVLDQAGIQIDCVAGTSAGAAIGAFYCAGFTVDEMIALAPHMNWRRLAGKSKSSAGLLCFDKLERWLMMMLGDVFFSELERPLAVVAMDAHTGERVILQHGRVAPAVRASSSVPGIVEPVEMDGRYLVDGGVVDNLPVDAARQLGADYVIAIDVLQPLRSPRWGALGAGISAIETLIQRAGNGVAKADFLISPNLAGRSFVHFSGYQELIAFGRKAAEERLPELLFELKRAP